MKKPRSERLFSYLAVQVREQHQDRLDDVEDKVNPVVFIHDITPSLVERRAELPLPCRAKYSTRSKSLQANFHLTRRLACDKFFAVNETNLMAGRRCESRRLPPR